MLGAVAGGVAAWVARKIVTNGARIFMSKIFSQKIWPKNWGGSSNRRFREWFVCGSRSCSTPPPSRADERYPGGPSRGRIFQARHSARTIDHWLVGRSAVGYQFHALSTDLVSDTALLIAVDPIGLFGVSVRPRQACPYS